MCSHVSSIKGVSMDIHSSGDSLGINFFFLNSFSGGAIIEQRFSLL